MTSTGRPSTGTPVQVRIQPHILDRIDREAAVRGITRAELLRRILGDWAGQ